MLTLISIPLVAIAILMKEFPLNIFTFCQREINEDDYNNNNNNNNNNTNITDMVFFTKCLNSYLLLRR